jgi:hypothetical protein
MRPYECSFTAEGKAALLEILLATERPVRIKRRGKREEWRVGRRIRYEWCVFWKESESDFWNVTFGGNFKTPEMLESLFAKTVARHRGCSWIWPERRYTS